MISTKEERDDALAAITGTILDIRRIISNRYTRLNEQTLQIRLQEFEEVVIQFENIHENFYKTLIHEDDKKSAMDIYHTNALEVEVLRKDVATFLSTPELGKNIKAAGSSVKSGRSQQSKSSSRKSSVSAIREGKAVEQAELKARLSQLDAKERLEAEERRLENMVQQMKLKKERHEVQTKLLMAEAATQAIDALYEDDEEDVDDLSDILHQQNPSINLHHMGTQRVVPSVHYDEVRTRSTRPQSSQFTVSREVQAVGETLANHQQRFIEILQAPPTEIKPFNGDPLKFYPFMKAFDNAVDSTSLSDCAKLTRLQKYCTGRPCKAIESCMSMESSAGYQEARKLLTERFGDKYNITKSWMDKILHRTQLRPNDPDALQDFADDLRDCNRTLISLGPQHAAELSIMSSLIQITGKLPNHLQNKWIDKVQDIKILKQPTIEDLIRFIEKAARAVNDLMYKALRSEQSANETILVSSTQPASLQKKQERPPCKLCHENHSLFGCKTFRKMNYQERSDFVDSNNLCSNCLRPGHNNSE